MKKLLSLPLSLPLALLVQFSGLAQNAASSNANANAEANIRSEARSLSLNQSENNTSSPAATVVNQDVNNNLMNLSGSGQYGYGPGIYCQGPVFAASATGSAFDGRDSGTNSFAASASIVIPLDGRAQRNCNDLAREIVNQRQLDTQLTLINQCITWAQAGVTLTEEAPEELRSACNSVNVAPRP